MKTSHISGLLVAILLILTSCREITVRTEINRDGSFTRTITITGDSSSVVKPGLPYPVDQSWQKEIRKDTLSEDNFILTYSKDYPSVKLLKEELDQDQSWMKGLNRDLQINKRFGFFYSYLEFKEIYPAANPFNNTPYSEFLSDEDMMRLQATYIPITPYDSALVEQAEERLDNYFANAISNAIISSIKTGINNHGSVHENLPDPEIYRDSIMKHVKDWEFDDPVVFIDYLISWSGDSSYSRLNNLKPSIFKELNEKVDFFETILEMEGYEQEVFLPGLLTSTNSAVIEGNNVSWTVDTQSFLITDYEMYAESRIVNLWAFILTGIILLLMIILLIIRVNK